MAKSLVDRLRKEKLTLVIENQGQLAFVSDRPGLEPLRDLVFANPELVDGSDAAMPTVGLGAAYLLINGKVGRVFTKVMTYEARRAFDDVGIEYEAGSHSRKLASDDPVASFHDAAKEAISWQAFVEELKRQVS